MKHKISEILLMKENKVSAIQLAEKKYFYLIKTITPIIVPCKFDCIS